MGESVAFAGLIVGTAGAGPGLAPDGYERDARGAARDTCVAFTASDRKRVLLDPQDERGTEQVPELDGGERAERRQLLGDHHEPGEVLVAERRQPERPVRLRGVGR
jgi:hypothetical protein